LLRLLLLLKGHLVGLVQGAVWVLIPLQHLLHLQAVAVREMVH
jgi:hypothetical protein